MNPSPSSDPSDPATPATPATPAAPRGATFAAWSTRLGSLGGALLLASVPALLAGLMTLALGELLRPGAGGSALAAALGSFVVGLPVALLLLKLARQVERQRRQMARFENTTPLPGAVARAQFIAVVEREWARARRYGHGAAVLVVEIDRFLRLSEAHGAAGVAELLEAMEGSTRQTLRGGDALAAWSESQIAVFLAHADAMGALDAAERIRERLEQLGIDWHGQTLKASVSVGVATLRPAHQHLQALLDDATVAVLAARQAGGNCVRAAPVDAGALQASGRSVGDNHRAGPK